MPKLRPPTKEERAAGLPKSRKDAIKMGITRYMRGDEEWQIRNFGSKTAPQGRDTRAALRTASRGGGKAGRRATYEDLSTYGSDKTAFGKSMTRAKAVNNQGDHSRDVSRTAHGLKGKPERTRRRRIGKWRAAKLAIGNDKNNVSSLTPDKNGKTKPTETNALDKKLKQMEKNNPSKRQGNKPGNIRGTGVKRRSGTLKMGKNYMRPPVAYTKSQLKSSNGSMKIGSHIGGDHLGIKSFSSDFHHNPFGIPIYKP